MDTDRFMEAWDAMTAAQRGAAVEAYFQKTHPGAKAVRANLTDFVYQHEFFDIKSSKSARPKLNAKQVENRISILWYDWSNVASSDGTFPVVRISAGDPQPRQAVWERCRFADFSGFIHQYRVDKAVAGGAGPETAAKARNRAYLAAKIHPIFNRRFGGKNRFGGRALHAKKMEPALLNGQYGKHDRSIILFFENEGTHDDVRLVVKEWWQFEHDRPVEEMKRRLKRHPVEEKYYVTLQAIQEGIVQIHTEEIRAED